jgi:hypothetical protein
MTPLGLEEKLWEKRNKVAYHAYGRHKSWKAGVKAGKHGASAADNPFKLPEDVLKLLRQRTYWEIGREFGAFRPPKKIKSKHKEEQMEHIKKEFKKKHKHKHHRH